jgi:hypothetical protein
VALHFLIHIDLAAIVSLKKSGQIIKPVLLLCAGGLTSAAAYSRRYIEVNP